MIAKFFTTSLLSVLVCFVPLVAFAQTMQSNSLEITDINFNTSIAVGIDQGGSPPIIFSPLISDLEPRKAIITWKTDKKANQSVKYGATAAYGLEQGTTSLSTDHTVTLFGLEPETTYHYQATSADVANSSASSKDASFTTPADTGINTIRISDISYTSVIVTWKTGNATLSRIRYGTDTSYGLTKATSSSALTSDHTVQLTDLKEGTEYHFRIEAQNDKGDLLRSTDQTFTTIAEPKFLRLTITSLDINSALVDWQTNTPTTGLVKYQATSGPNQDEQSAGTSDLAVRRQLKLTKLIGDTVYSLKIIATDQQGKQVVSSPQTFRTPLDKDPPTLSELRVAVTRSGDALVMTATWKTNEPSRAEMVFGPKTRVDQTVDLPGPDSYTTDHTLVATGLLPSTPFSLTAFATDLAGNRGKADISFVTPKLSKTIFQLLIDSFLSHFGWLTNLFSR